MKNAFVPAIIGSILLGGIQPGRAQVQPKSQLGSITQLIDRARIEITYRRPVARGRILFGGLVPWGRIWTPSADTAVRMTVSTPIEVNGSNLAAGSYSVWTIPDSTSWTIIFNRTATVFHLRYPSGNDALRIQAKPAQGEYVETLQWEFPMVDADSAILELHWGTTIVPMRIRSRGN